MVEINGNVDYPDSLYTLEMIVPTMTDSVFFVSGSTKDESEVKILNIQDKNLNKWVSTQTKKTLEQVELKI